MTLFDVLLAAVIVVAFLAGMLMTTLVLERRHDCLPHDPATCRPERPDAETLRLYAGRWVVVRNGKVVHSAPNAHQLSNDLREIGRDGDRAFFVPKDQQQAAQ